VVTKHAIRPDQGRTVWVFDADPSTYKAIVRMGTANGWVVNQLALDQPVPPSAGEHAAPAYAGCLVIDLKHFAQLEASDILRTPAHRAVIGMSRNGLASSELSRVGPSLFEFVDKPFRLDHMRGVIQRGFEFLDQLEVDSEISDETIDRFNRLTKRELEICELLAEGWVNKTISEKLGIAIKTVKAHRANLMRKVEAESLIELVRGCDLFRHARNLDGVTAQGASGLSSKVQRLHDTRQ